MHTKGGKRGTCDRKTQYSRVHLPHLGARHWMKGVIPHKIHFLKKKSFFIVETGPKNSTAQIANISKITVDRV